MINWWRNDYDISEISAITNAIKNKKISQGELTEQFERALAEFLNIPFCVCVPSGTAALTLAYMAVGLKAGDEIITSDKTFIATAHAATILGANVKAVDITVDMKINEKLIENKITDKTKIIVPVHLNGIASNMESICNIANKHNLSIVEDACQAFGSKHENNFLGTMGRFGCFSTGITKILNTVQGGFVTAKTQEDYDLLRRLRNQGVFDVRKEQLYNIMAFNFKFNDLQAALGLSQLSKLEQKLKTCKNIYKLYEEKLQNKFDFIQCSLDSCVPLRFLLLHENNTQIKEKLLQSGIECSFDPPPLHNCPHLQINGDFKNSDKINRRLLILPSGPSQDLKDIEFVAHKLNKL